MAQAPPQTRSRRLIRRITLLSALLLAIGVLAKAQTAPAIPPPYLLLQGPSAKKSARFLLGEQLVVRLREEDEFYRLRLNGLYPDAQAALLGENLIRLSDIAALRIAKRPGLKRYFQIQGLVNLVTIGLVALIDSEARERQRGFVLGSSAVSAAMVLYGSLGRTSTRELGRGRRYILAIGGGVEAVEEARAVPRRY